ncbi:MAG: DUF4271 domain-containing protein [Cytophagales bacterium]|nr:DUF4271 domain-containing protein [Cytophagales bacterium]
MKFCGSSIFTIWIEGRRIASNKNGRCIYLSSDELCSFSNRESPYLSLVSENGFEEIIAYTIAITEGQESEKLLVRSDQSPYWIFGFLFGSMLLVSVQKVRPKTNWRFQRPHLKEFSDRFATVENMISLLIVAVINAFSISFLNGESESISIFQMVLLILLGWFGKFMLTIFSGSVFNIWRWANWQLIFQLRFWVITSLLSFVLLFLDFIFFAESKVSSEMILNIWAVVSLIVLVMTSVVLLSQKGLKNLHIFIYLCTTEILPVTLLVYFFLE